MPIHSYRKQNRDCWSPGVFKEGEQGENMKLSNESVGGDFMFILIVAMILKVHVYVKLVWLYNVF